MNILQLSRTSVYPPQNGAEVRVWKTTEKLADLGNLWLAAPPGCDSLPGDMKRIELTSPLFTQPLIWNECWTGLFLLAERHPLRRPLASAIVGAVDEYDVSFDVIVCEFPQMADGAFRLAAENDASVLLNQHNAEHEIFDGVLREHGVPDRLRRRAVANFRSFEEQVIATADVTVFQSDDNRARFEDSLGPNTFVIPNGCDLQWIRDGGDPQEAARECGVDRDAFICVFLGSYDYAPNRQAAAFISEELAPRLPGIEFLLVGRNPPSVSVDNVHTPGYIDELPGALQISDVALCPLSSGSGTKLKMLDYFAAELPTVTTPVGAQGLAVEHEREVLVYDSVDGIATGIRRLRESPSLRGQLSRAGSKVASEHSWESLMAKYDDVFESITSG